MKKLSKIVVEKPIMAQRYYNNINLDKKEDIVPVNISEKMLDAISTFREQYIMASKKNENLILLIGSTKFNGF